MWALAIFLAITAFKFAAIIALFIAFCYITIRIIKIFSKKYRKKQTQVHIQSKESSKHNITTPDFDVDNYAKECNAYCEFKETIPTDITNLKGSFRFNDKRFTEKYTESFDSQISSKTLHDIQNIIVSTYSNFGVSVKVNNFNLTKYYAIAETIPCSGTSVKSVLAFQNEISIALGTEVIINAMYEKGYVGIIIPMNYIKEINNIIENSNQICASSTNNDTQKDFNNDRDVYFVDAGRFIIEKEKASIGMLQRVFKIGFNHAARIMDQLKEAGVVSKEEETKPRKVLMSMEEFEEYIEK